MKCVFAEACCGSKIGEVMTTVSRMPLRAFSISVACTVIFLAMTTPRTSAGSLEETPKTLAEQFRVLAESAIAEDDNDAIEKATKALKLLEDIVNQFPRSLEATLLRRQDRLPNSSIDIKTIRSIAGVPEGFQGDQMFAQLPTSELKRPTKNAVEKVGEGLALYAEPAQSVAASPGIGTPLGREAFGRVSARKGVSNRPDFFDRLRRTSVLLYFIGSSSNGTIVANHVGSGSFIGPDLILTNSHVAEVGARHQGSWLVINETIGVRKAYVVSMAQHHTPLKIDAAVLRIEGYSSDVWLSFNASSKLDDQIFIAGYPGDATRLDRRYSVLEASLRAATVPDVSRLPTAVVDEGRINNFIEDSGSKTVNLQYTMVTAPGNSGSPIVNSCGQIVGLHYSGGVQGADVKFNGAVHARDLEVYLKYYVGVEVDFSPDPCR